MDATSDRVMWVKGGRKNSRLFIGLLKRLLVEYADKRVMHVILDNYIVLDHRERGFGDAGRGGQVVQGHRQPRRRRRIFWPSGSLARMAAGSLASAAKLSASSRFCGRRAASQ